MSFTRMDQSKKEDWINIGMEHIPLQEQCPETIIFMLKQLEKIQGGFGVTQLHHVLQTATMAQRAGASEEMVLCSLCHDIGKFISVPNHGQIAAEILKPYVSNECYWVIKTHQDFQGRHYYHYFDKDPNARDQYRNEPWFALAEQFTDEWDQAAFDPDYDILTLDDFEPLIRKYFSKITM